MSNDDVQIPQRPTFLQAAPLLSAFMSTGGGSSGSGGSSQAGCQAAASGLCSNDSPATGAAAEPIIVAAHNARFDARLLAAEFGRQELLLPAHWR